MSIYELLFFPNLAGHELLRVRTSRSDLALHTVKLIAQELKHNLQSL